MARSLSRQARILLLALARSGQEWSHGYELARSTGLRSGTLYPLLIRLESQGYLQAQWQSPAGAGRPPRHAYRLSAAGLALARSVEEMGGGETPSPPVTHGAALS